MGRCLGTAPSSVSAVVRDSTPQGVTPGSPDSLEGRNSVDTCSNGTSEEPSACTQRVDANGVVAR